MNRIIFIHDPPDLYELRVQGCVIHRITKYLGDSSISRDVEYSDLPAKIRDRIIEELSQYN